MPKKEEKRSQIRRWSPGLIHHVPWDAIIALILVQLCVVSSVAVLYLSNGVSVEGWLQKWSHRPVVYLAIFSAAANVLLKYALCTSRVVSWWRLALKGSTLAELQSNWEHGSGVAGTLKPRNRFSFLASAQILVFLTVVDNPLLQQASSAVTRIIPQNTNLIIPFAPDPLPYGYTGWTVGRGSADVYTFNFTQTLRSFNNREAISLNYTGCHINSTCRGTVTGPGFDYSCHTSNKHYNISYKPGDSTPVFSFNASLSWGESTMSLSSFLKNDSNLAYKLAPPPLLREDCQLNYAIVKYPISVHNGTILLQPRTANETIHYQGVPPETHGMGIWPTVLGGFCQWASDRYSASAELYMNGSPFELDLTGDLAREYVKNADSNEAFIDGSIAWVNPMNDVVNEIREVMFRTAVAASNSTYKQIVPSVDNFSTTVYESNYKYLAAAMTVMILATISVLPSLSGWRHLGRPTSLSPLEIAKAFDAPMLRECGSNTTVREALSVVENKKVQYGELLSAEIHPDLDTEQEHLLSSRRFNHVQPEIRRKPLRGAQDSSEELTADHAMELASMLNVRDIDDDREGRSVRNLGLKPTPKGSTLQTKNVSTYSTHSTGEDDPSIYSHTKTQFQANRLSMADPTMCQRPRKGVFYS